MKKLLFLTLALFFIITGVAESRVITFKMVNEFGVPQPIEVRRVYSGTVEEIPFVGFGEVKVPYNIAPDNLTVRITRRYAAQPSQSNPEGPGIPYTITPTSPSVVTKEVPAIKTTLTPRPIKPVDRALLGLINDVRQDNGLNRLGRVPELDELASIWAQQIALGGNRMVHNESLIWNYGLDAFFRRTTYFWSYSKASILSRLDEYCGVSQTELCRDAVLEPEVEAIAISTINGLSWVFFLNDCSGVVGCQQTDDSGDSKLLDSIFCQDCSGSNLKKNPELKIIKKTKRPRSLRVWASTKKGARGVAKLVVRQKNNRLSIKGKKTSYGFVFKSNKKRPLIRYNKKFKARIVFKGRGNWRSDSIKIR